MTGFFADIPPIRYQGTESTDPLAFRFYDKDRLFAPDIEAAKQLVLEGSLSATCQDLFAGLYLA